MKIVMTRPVELEVKAIRCELAVRYEEEDIPNDFPFRRGDMLTLTIDIDTGQIANWPADAGARKVFMKVCDSGSYYLIGADGSEVAKLENEYVPNCIPGDSGDYVDFKIDATGKITNWATDDDEVERSFFGDD